MSLFQRLKRKCLDNRVTSVVVLLIFSGLIWQAGSANTGAPKDKEAARAAQGIFYGDMPAPADPSVGDTIQEVFAPNQKFKLMTIQHIPRIKAGDPMPHPFVGPCANCHLFLGGPGPGKQFKTPVGAALEKISRIKKLGPPLLPSSDRPHPPAGRCIKCHDVVIKIPTKRKKGGFKWIM